MRDRFPFLQSVWENGTDLTVTAPPPAPRAWGGHRGGVPPRVAGHDRAGGAPLGADATDLPLPSSVDQACVTSLALHLPHTPREAFFPLWKVGARVHRSTPAADAPPPLLRMGLGEEPLIRAQSGLLHQARLWRWRFFRAARRISPKLSPAAATFLLHSQATQVEQIHFCSSLQN